MENLSTESKKILETHNEVYIYDGFWNASICKKDNKSLYVFGDNDIGRGQKGQAVIRKCSNSIGIPTKKIPNYKMSSYYIDDEYEENCKKILKAIEKVIIESQKYDSITFPRDGFGTGLAKLDVYAPKTKKFLNNILFECFGVEY